MLELRTVGAALAAVVISTATMAATAAAAPSPALPGGKYAGETTKQVGKRVVVKVKAASAAGELRGLVRYPCAGLKARFRSGDGTFTARKRRHGRTIFKAEGSFRRMQHAVGKVHLKGSRRHGACRPARFRAELDNAPRIEKATVDYSHFTVPGGSGMGKPGSLEGGRGNIAKPCDDCQIVGMVPDLREADGSEANFNTMSMLHHVVLFNSSARDTVCSRWPQRFFASGNERTTFVLPRGYGYAVNASDRWRLITHLMNMSDAAKDLTIRMTFYYVRGASTLQPVTPFWFDIASCGNSEYTTPAGLHTEMRDFKVPPALDGKVVAIGGHLHDYGRSITLADMTSRKTICTGKAGFDNDPAYMGHIDSVSGCADRRGVGRLHAGDRVRLASTYDAPEKIEGVMGIMVGYVAGDG